MMDRFLRILRLSALCLLFSALLPPLFGQPTTARQDSLPADYTRLIDRSFEALGQGNLELAEQALRQAIKAYPDLPSGYALMNNLGAIQQRQGKPEEALLTYSAALQKLPDDKLLRTNRAMLLTEMGRTDEAIFDYNELLRAEPDNEIFHYGRAMLYLAKGMYGDAESDLEEILRVNDSSLKARLGIALVATMKGEYDKAERLYNYVIDKLPKNAAAYEGRARLFLNKGMKGYALRDINKAFECATPPAASLFVLRGEINAAIGDKKAAAEDYAAAESRGYSKESLDVLRAALRKQ